MGTFPQSDRGKARDQATDLTGANPRYVSDAKRLKQAAPQVFARVVNGTVSLPEAKKLSNQVGAERTAPSSSATPAASIWACSASATL